MNKFLTGLILNVALIGGPYVSQASTTPLNNAVFTAPASVAALRAIPVTAGMNGYQISTLGYWTSGDGGGNTFIYNSASGLSDNGGTVIVPSAGGGAWISTSTNYDWKRFGANGNSLAVRLPTTIGLGSNVLTLNGASFAATDVGKSIVVGGAGSAGAGLYGTITGYTSSSQVTLSVTAATAVTGTTEISIYGTDDTTAIQNALTAAGNVPYFQTSYPSAGLYFISRTLNLPPGVSIHGIGDQATFASTQYGTQLVGYLTGYVIQQAYGSPTESYSHIDNLSINVNCTLGCLYFENANEWEVGNCTLYGGTSVADLTIDGNPGCINPLIQNNIFFGHTTYGIQIIGDNHTNVCFFHNYITPVCTAGLYIHCTQGDFTSYSDIFENNATGVLVDGDVASAGGVPKFYSFSDYFEGESTACYSVNPDGYTNLEPIVTIRNAHESGNSITPNFLLYGPCKNLDVQDAQITGETGASFVMGTMTGVTDPVSLKGITSTAPYTSSPIVSSTPSTVNTTDYVWRSGYNGWGGTGGVGGQSLIAGWEVAPTYSGSAYGIFDEPQFTATANSQQFYGMETLPSIATGTYSSLIYRGGYIPTPTVTGSGLGSAYQMIVDNGGAFTNLAGLAINSQTNGLTNNTDLLFGTLTIPSGTFGLYQGDSYANSLGGSLTLRGNGAGALVSSSAGLISAQTNDYQADLTGTAYTLTASNAAITGGTTSPTITLGAAGTYIITAGINCLYSGATYAATQNVTFSLYRTNNTPASIYNGTFILRTITTTSDTACTPTLKYIYTTTNSNDVVTIYGQLSATPSAGSVQIQNPTYIVAQRIY
jgi:hypothetical protein